MNKVALINCTNSKENTCARASFLINLQAWGLKLEILAHAFSFEFCEISKNALFIEHHLDDCFWFYLWRVFIIFNIKNFRHEKRRFVRKKSTSGKPALHFESDLPSFSTLYILSKKEWPCRNRGLPYSNLSLVIFRLSFFLFLYTNSDENPFSTEFFFLVDPDYGSIHWEVLLKNSCS